MFGVIVRNELRNNLLSLRFHIAFVLVVATFAAGTITFLKKHHSMMQEYSKYQNELTAQQMKTAQSNLSQFAVTQWPFTLKPRPNSFISDCKETYFPNRFSYNAYNIFGFEAGRAATNPFLGGFQDINWSFITSVVLSFTVLLLTFDTVSGQRESNTLALVLANPISRATVLCGKYVTALLTTMLTVVVGVILSVLIIVLSGGIDLSASSFLEILGFLLLVLLFTSCIAAFGILSSVLVRSSNVSLLIGLAFWLLFVVVIPNSAVFWANKVFAIEHANTVNERISAARTELNRSAPPGSWTADGGFPFLPEHQLRAALQMKLMNSEMEIRNTYYRNMFVQLSRTRLLTTISPVALFEYMTEAVVAGGYLRFTHTWGDLHEYQRQFLDFFKRIDAADLNSPHWYNPYEDLSTTKKPVSFEQVPLFEEKPLSLAARFYFLKNYLVVMIVYIVAVFSLAFVSFLRYDVR
jgi:ABC-type transport system involved in multi-copper enzyme maturation permease subunit